MLTRKEADLKLLELNDRSRERSKYRFVGRTPACGAWCILEFLPEYDVLPKVIAS